MDTRDIKKAQKQELRRKIRDLRAAHTEEQIHQMSLKICERLFSLEEYRKASVIYAYMDCKNEVETGDIIRHALKTGKKVAMPKVLGERIQFFYIRSLEEDLEDGYFGIREPKEEHPACTEDALLVMPGVAFDEGCHRVGYGGGFYDRFLQENPKLTTVALAFEFQVQKEVPFENFDIRPGKIITEKRVITAMEQEGI